jgi:hypothetical protein
VQHAIGIEVGFEIFHKTISKIQGLGLPMGQAARQKAGSWAARATS